MLQTVIHFVAKASALSMSILFARDVHGEIVIPASRNTSVGSTLDCNETSWPQCQTESRALVLNSVYVPWVTYRHGW
jgi:hypothetical protein